MFEDIGKCSTMLDDVGRCSTMFNGVRRLSPSLSKKPDISATFSPWVAHTFQNDYLGRYGVSNSCQTLSRPEC